VTQYHVHLPLVLRNAPYQLGGQNPAPRHEAGISRLKGATAITQTPAADTIALVASEPEHCLDCFRMIRPGETYHLGKNGTVLCPMCVSGLLTATPDPTNLPSGLIRERGRFETLYRAGYAIPPELPTSVCGAGTVSPRPGALSRSPQ